MLKKRQSFLLTFIFWLMAIPIYAQDSLERIIDFDLMTSKEESLEHLIAVQINWPIIPFLPRLTSKALNRTERNNLDTFEQLLRVPAAIVPYEDGLESVFYPDEREEVEDTNIFPASAVVLIVTNNLGRCSGWVIGESTIVTAGHCVHAGGSGGEWAENVVIYAGKNGSVSPFGQCRAVSLHSVEGWVRERDKNYDYGAIRVDCELSKATGSFGILNPDEEIENIRVEISGYPVDKPLTQWSTESSVTLANSLKVFHRADTMGGMSGSAIHSGDYYVFAIHTNAKHNGEPWRSNNAGTRLTPIRVANVMYWVSLETD